MILYGLELPHLALLYPMILLRKNEYNLGLLVGRIIVKIKPSYVVFSDSEFYADHLSIILQLESNAFSKRKWG